VNVPLREKVSCNNDDLALKGFFLYCRTSCQEDLYNERTFGGGCFGHRYFGVLIVLLLGLGAMVLRGACGVVGVKETPSFGYAIVILLVAGFAQSLIMAPINWIGLDYTVITLLVSAGVSSFIYSLMVPVNLAKAFVIWIVQAVIGFVAILGLGMAIGMLVSML
jgi:hypothetical protein